MEPRIQYAKTSDGVSIAYTVSGDGPPFVSLTGPPVSNIIWRQPRFHDAYRDFRPDVDGPVTHVLFDARGMGYSDRDVSDFSLDALVSDLEAVVDALALPPFALFANNFGGPQAVTYAARYPERLSHLILSFTYARARDWVGHEQAQAMLGLLDLNWELYTESWAGVGVGWGDPQSHAFGELIRASLTQQVARPFWEAVYSFDVSDLLPLISVPTLVAHGVFSPWSRVLTLDAATKMASSIPDARLVVLDDEDALREFNHRTIREFVGVPIASRADEAPISSGTAVILFADIADSTALTEGLGDAAFREKARTLDAALRRAIASNGGTAIEGKLLGDGVLATFGAAREAIACAMAIHRMAGPWDKGQGPEQDDALLHVGIHAGDVIRESNNVYGGAVNIAARVAGEAAAGETLVSQTVRDLARTSAGVSFEDRGENELKGVGEPMRLYEVRWRD